MKLSTSGFARGRAATIIALLVMGGLIALSQGNIDPTLTCVAGIVTWFVVTALLAANKDRRVF